MMRGILCAVMCMMMLSFVFASAESYADSDIGVLYEERTVFPSDINPEEDFVADEESQGFKPGSRQEILESIVNLRAYCLLAYDKAKSFADMHPSSNSGLMSFIIAFGKKDTKKQKMSNVVTGFATAIGESKGKFEQGVSHYLLMHLGKAVFEGKKAVARSKVFGEDFAAFEFKKMGLESRPGYFNKIAVRYMPFVALAQKVRSESQHADAQAAAAWLASGGKAKYKSFEDKVQATVAQKAQKYKEDVYMSSLKAIKTSWEKSHALDKMPVAGSVAGASVPAVRIANAAEVAAEALQAAKKWVKENKPNAEDSASDSASKTAEQNAENKK